jgi:uncharacterized membrane protein YoaK (UPF0700 family)
MGPRSDSVRNILLIALAACAGAFDAVSYLRLHTFTANMTGNTVLLALWLGGRHLGEVSHGVTAIACYALGAFLGRLVTGNADERHPWPAEIIRAFLLEAGFVVAFAVLWPLLPESQLRILMLLALGSAAMGTQAAIAHGAHLGSSTTTAMTGTIARSSEGLAEAAKAGLQPFPIAKPASWAVYFCAALAVGAFDRMQGDIRVAAWGVAVVLLAIAFGARHFVHEAPGKAARKPDGHQTAASPE